MRTSDKKRKFLVCVGFEQKYEAEPRLSMGVSVTMEEWVKITGSVVYSLYVHFAEGESSSCELYCGDGDTPDTFSERNLISELKKRGFNSKQND